jgi:AbrB family looped-hinge helix DNA binding protein
VRVRAKDPLDPDYLATNYRAATITDRQRAMLDYCVMLSMRPLEACGARSIEMTISLRPAISKGIVMDASAKITSKGQVTIPRSVREALDLHEGDEVVFRVEKTRAVLAKTPNFLSLAASVAVPAARRGTAWDDVLRRARRRRGEARR